MTDFAQESIKTQKGILVVHSNKQRKYLKFQYNPESISISHATEGLMTAADLAFFPGLISSGTVNREISFSIIFENILSKLDIEVQLKWLEAWQRAYFRLFFGEQKFSGAMVGLSWNYKEFWPNLTPRYVEVQLRFACIIPIGDVAGANTLDQTNAEKAASATSATGSDGKITNTVQSPYKQGIILSGPQI